jgi:deoxyribodipyrimidine photo-lyase
LLESVADLRNSLRAVGSDLIIRKGKPEEILLQLAKELNITELYYSKEITSEEVAVETALETALKPLGIALTSFWGHTLFHPDDLPFEISQIPEVFTQFRKQVEKSSTVNPTFATPQQLPPNLWSGNRRPANISRVGIRNRIRNPKI